MAVLIFPRRIALWTRVALAAALLSLALPLALMAHHRLVCVRAF